MATASQRETDLRDRLIDVANAKSLYDANAEIASDRFQAALSPMPSPSWPPQQRLDVTKDLLREAISRLPERRFRVAASAALRLAAGRPEDYKHGTADYLPSLEDMWYGADWNQPSRLQAAWEVVLGKPQNLPKKSDGTIEWRHANKDETGTSRGWWREASEMVVRDLLDQIDRKTRENAWPPPKASSPLTGLGMQEFLAWVSSSPEWSLLQAGTDMADWREALDGSPLSTNHAAMQAVIDRTATVDGRHLNPDAALEWLRQQGGRTVLLQGDAGDGKTSYLSLLASRGEATHLFLTCQTEALVNLPELVMRLAASSTMSESPCVVVVLELQPYLPPTAWHAIGSALADRHEGLTVLVSGRPAELRRLQYYDLPRCERLSLSALRQGEAEQLADLICRAHDELLADGWSAETISYRYPNLPRFRSSSPSAQLKTLQTDPHDPLIARLLRAVYGPDSRGVLAGEARRLDRSSRLAYIAVCLASAIGQSLPGSLLGAIAPDVDFDERSLRDPWTLGSDGRHQARHPLIAQVVLQDAPAGLQALTDIFDSWLAVVTDSSNRALLATVIGAVPQWPLSGQTTTAGDFKNHLLQAVRVSLGTSSLQDDLLRGCQNRYADCIEWGRITYALVPHDSKSPAHVPLLELASALFDRASRTTDRLDPEWLIHPRQAVAVHTDRLAGTLDLDRIVTAIRAVSPLMKRPWAGEPLYTDVFNWAVSGLALLDPQPLQGPTATKAVSLYSGLYRAHEHLRALHQEGAIDSKKMAWVNRQRGELMTRLIFEHLPTRARDLIFEEWRFSVSLGNPNMGSLDMYVREFAGPKCTFAISEETAQELTNEILSGLAERPNHTGTLYLLARISKDRPFARTAAVDQLRRVDPSVLSRLEQAYFAHARALLEDSSTLRSQILLAATESYARESTDKFRFDRVKDDWKLACSELAQTGSSQAAAEQKRFRRYESRMH